MRGVYHADLLKLAPVVGILRGFSGEQSRCVVRAAAAGGLRNLEITMNTTGAAEQISEACLVANDQMNIGAGTVTSLDLLNQALEAGAGFIVTPTLCIPVVQRCVELGVPVFPGSMSPSEVLAGWELGATMVKVFPSELMGPGYVRSLKAPFPGVRLMPTGGVDLTSLGEYAAAGASAFGIGGPLFDRARVEAEDWMWVERRCREFVDAATRLVG